MNTHSLLENAQVVHHDRVRPEPLAFVDGRVAARVGAGALRVDLHDHFVFPGLINAHDHLQLNAIPPPAQSETFANSYQWIDAFEAHLGDPDILATRRVPTETRHWHGALKNLFAGVTCVAHHDPWHSVFDDSDFPVRVLRESGWSHSLGLGAPRDGCPSRYGPPLRESFCTTSAEHPWIIHVAEGTDDVAAAELTQLDALGCLASNTVLVHGVALTSADIERVIEAGAAVVWCPASNLTMLGRTLQPRPLFDAGHLTLGTDSRLTGSRDLLDELRVAAANSDLSSRELLRLVTADASRLLRLPSSGGLHEGQHADCVVIRSDGDPYDALLRATRSSIRAIVFDGLPAIADPDFADWFEECDVAVDQVRLDGHPKLVARSVARFEPMELERGVELRCAR